MEVYVLTEEGNGSAEFVGAWRKASTAKKMFSAYLDGLEAAWRDCDGIINATNTFNRFCEPTESTILNATCGDIFVRVRKLIVE